MTATDNQTPPGALRPASLLGPEAAPVGPPREPGAMGRERSVTEAFVAIADSLAAGCDLMDLYTRLTSDCARVLDAAAAGLLLADATGKLHVLAASSERTRDLECFEVQCAEGPCLDSYWTGMTVLVPDLAAARTQWPRFVSIAVEAGFASVHAVPMRLAGQVLGSLNLFHTRPGPLNGDDLRLAQAFAHVASVALVAGKAVADTAARAVQLQTALDSRVVLEQAKGIVAQLGEVELGQAFDVLRRYARDHNLTLSELAAIVVSRHMLAGVVLAHARAKGVLAPSAR